MWNVLYAIIMIMVSILLFVLGYMLWKKQKIEVMHEYHYTNVSKQNRQAYTTIMGQALFVIAVGMLVSGICSLFMDVTKLWIVAVVGIVVGVGMMVYGQMKYNRGIF